MPDYIVRRSDFKPRLMAVHQTWDCARHGELEVCVEVLARGFKIHVYDSDRHLTSVYVKTLHNNNEMDEEDWKVALEVANELLAAIHYHL